VTLLGNSSTNSGALLTKSTRLELSGLVTLMVITFETTGTSDIWNYVSVNMQYKQNYFVKISDKLR
jgi:hypothetical protein